MCGETTSSMRHDRNKASTALSSVPPYSDMPFIPREKGELENQDEDESDVVKLWVLLLLPLDIRWALARGLRSAGDGHDVTVTMDMRMMWVG